MVAVSISADPVMLAMIDAISEKSSYGSRAGVVKEAVRQMYKREFSASGVKHPVPMRGVLASQIKVVSEERQRQKTALEKARENEVLGSGKQLCEVFMKGHVTGLGGPIGQVKCDRRQVRGNEVYSPLSELFLTDMPILGESWEEDISAREFLLANTFPDFKWNPKNEDPRMKSRFKESLKVQMQLLIYGIVRDHKISPEDISVEALDLLVEKLQSVGLDTKDLEQAILDGGFRSQPAHI